MPLRCILEFIGERSGERNTKRRGGCNSPEDEIAAADECRLRGVRFQDADPLRNLDVLQFSFYSSRTGCNGDIRTGRVWGIRLARNNRSRKKENEPEPEFRLHV